MENVDLLSTFWISLPRGWSCGNVYHCISAAGFLGSNKKRQNTRADAESNLTRFRGVFCFHTGFHMFEEVWTGSWFSFPSISCPLWYFLKRFHVQHWKSRRATQHLHINGGKLLCIKTLCIWYPFVLHRPSIHSNMHESTCFGCAMIMTSWYPKEEK